MLACPDLVVVLHFEELLHLRFDLWRHTEGRNLKPLHRRYKRYRKEIQLCFSSGCDGVCERGAQRAATGVQHTARRKAGYGNEHRRKRTPAEFVPRKPYAGSNRDAIIRTAPPSVKEMEKL